MAITNKVDFSIATGGGNSTHLTIKGPFVLEITSCPSGATVTIQHSTDDGSTWTTAAGDAAGTGASYTVARLFVIDMPVFGVWTRVSVSGTFTGNCTGRLGL